MYPSSTARERTPFTRHWHRLDAWSTIPPRKGGNSVNLITKQRIVRVSVVLSVYFGSLAVALVCFDHGALRAGASIMLAFLFGSPFLLKFLIPRALARFAPGSVPNVPLDDAARKLILYRIRSQKIWITILVILFPMGVADAASHRAWLPMLVGGGISLFLMYASLLQVRNLQRRLRTDMIAPTPE